MTKKMLFAFILSLLVLVNLCSWVDPETVDVYTGNIQYADTNNYDVARLSGPIQYWLSSYNGINQDANGHIFNTSGTVVSGQALISGVEFDIRFSTHSGLQIQQQYYYGTSYRSVWVSYDLMPDQVPTPYGLPEYSLVIIALSVLLMLAIFMMGHNEIT